MYTYTYCINCYHYQYFNIGIQIPGRVSWYTTTSRPKCKHVMISVLCRAFMIETERDVVHVTSFDALYMNLV